MSRTKEVTGLKNASECLKVVCLKKKKKKQLAKTQHLRDGKCSLPVNDSCTALFCSST